MNPWYLVIALCLVDGFLCHELMKAWDKKGNRPLTLERLQAMSWEPAWIEGDCETELGHNGWAIISQHKTQKYVCVWWPGEDYADIPSLDNYSNTWLAYHRKPKEVK